MLHVCHTFAAEPASILYLATGAASFAIARRGAPAQTQAETSTFLLFTKTRSRALLESLNLL